MEQIRGAGQAGEVPTKCYKAGGFVTPGMISHGLSMILSLTGVIERHSVEWITSWSNARPFR